MRICLEHDGAFRRTVQFRLVRSRYRAGGEAQDVTVVGTPTAAPPAWLTQKYPETLRIDENGKRAVHGNRAQASPTSPKYRELCRRIAEQMALHFGHNPNVAGWQIDNEYGYAQMSYDDGTKTKFQGWLKEKYKTLDNLNTRWTTSYWSQTYDNWERDSNSRRST